MADLSIIRREDMIDLPLTAQKKWLESQLQEKKSGMFALKQQLDKCEQEIEDIKEGKIKKIQYSMIVLAEEVRKITETLNEVIIK